jgi:hypothetical protein
MNSGRTTLGLGAGYANRRYLVPAGSSVLAGSSDDTYYAQLFASRALSGRSGVNGNMFVNYYQSSIAGAPGVFGGGAAGSYYHNFGPLSAVASVGISSFEVDGEGSNTQAQAQLGLRYGF